MTIGDLANDAAAVVERLRERQREREREAAEFERQAEAVTAAAAEAEAASAAERQAADALRRAEHAAKTRQDAVTFWRHVLDLTDNGAAFLATVDALAVDSRGTMHGQRLPHEAAEAVRYVRQFVRRRDTWAERLRLAETKAAEAVRALAETPRL